MVAATKKHHRHETNALLNNATPQKTGENPKTKAPNQQTTVSGSCCATAALLYLRQWKKHRTEWKFQKHRQIWLLRHMYDVQKITEKKFRWLLAYLADSKGKSREKTIDDAKTYLDNKSNAVNTEQLDRARRILQLLDE